MRTRTSDDDIWDENGLLKDGKVFRTRMVAMDAATVRDPRLHKPGPRLRDDMNVTQRQRAYDAYDDLLTNAWRGKDASGEYPEAAIGSPCTCRNEYFPEDFGSPGTVKRTRYGIVCVPDRDDDDTDEADQQATSDSRRTDSRSVQQRRQDHETRHQDRMEKLYDARDAELREAWRNP